MVIYNSMSLLDKPLAIKCYKKEYIPLTALDKEQLAISYRKRIEEKKASGTKWIKKNHKWKLK